MSNFPVFEEMTLNTEKTAHSLPSKFRLLFSIVIILSLMAGCHQLPWQPSSENAALDVEDVETEQLLVPTREPRKDLPPALVEVFPIPDDFIGLQEPISLFFNQPMDIASVEAAIHFEPSISGRFDWEDDQILTFYPDQSLPAGSRFHLAINTSAQAANKKTLQEAIEIDFQTVESLKVIQTMPVDDAMDVAPESAVFVAFNQPVVPLGAEALAEPAFTLSPDVTGKGEWINTNTYIFTPDPTMNGGTVYTIELNESLTATSGSRLAASQRLEYTFTTTYPSVMSINPPPEDRLGLNGPIEVRFNVRMDTESVEANFSLIRLDGTGVPGSFEWDENLKGFAFFPDETLNRNTTYTVRIRSETESVGGLPIGEETETSRISFPSFSIDPAMSPEFQSYYGEYGQYNIRFTTPLDREDYADNVNIIPDVSWQSTFITDGDKSLFLTGYFHPETDYSVTLDANLKDIWGGSLGEEAIYSFTTPPAKPSLSLLPGVTAHNMIFIPASVSELVLQATNINTLVLEIAPISLTDLVTLLHPENYSYRQLFLPENLEEITHHLELERNVSEVISVPLSFQENPLTPGVYFLGLSSPDIDDDVAQNYHKLYLIVSDNNLVMKVGPEQAFVWASQLENYEPLSNVPIAVLNSEGDLLTSGKTDSQGFFMGEFDRFDEPYTSFFSYVGEPGQADFGFSISTWGDQFELYEAGILLNTLPALSEAYIYTDRPIYRPGDSVYYRAAVFTRDNGIPAPAGLENVTVSIYSDAGMSGIPVRLYEEVKALSQFGTVDGGMVLPKDAPTGMYRIELAHEEGLMQVLYFDVAAYRKPEIELQVDLTPSEILAGEMLVASIQADYYFGLPASGQTFSWTLFRDDIYFVLPGYQVGPLFTPWLSPPQVDYFSPLGTIIASGEGATDEQGHAGLNFVKNDLLPPDEKVGHLQAYHLEITVKDESGFPVSHHDSAMMHPEKFYIGVRPESYFGQADSSFSFSLKTVDWNKQPVGEIALEATFEAITWEVERTFNPENPYRYIPQTTFINNASPKTGSGGNARVSFTPPEPGTYRLTLESGEAVTQVLVWVAGSGSAVWPRQTRNQISLTPDSSNYQPGEMAEIFFPNPFENNARALVTVERGQVMSAQVLEVEGAGHMLSIPITADSIPNIYISVMLFGENDTGNPDFRQGIINLPVAPISKTLNVDLSLDPIETRPGERVSATLKITDLEGNPVQGEFSISVVDKAVLALVAPNSPPILEAFYGEQPLSIQTSFSLKSYATQMALTSMDNGRGGGGDMMALPTIREDFPDTAFWQADVITGVDGTARLDISLPDTLTTWVVVARGLTEDYLVGEAEAEVLTQKELMIRPVTPRFLVDGDEVEMAAVVHNNTTESRDAFVSLQGSGFILTNPNQQTQLVTIPPGSSIRVDWWGRVESLVSLSLFFQAVSGTLDDASTPIWGDLPVMRYNMPHTFSTSGQLTDEGERLEVVSLPMSTDLSSGELILEINPSLTAALVEGLDALEHTPYNDTASILSRLMANLSAYQALSNLGIDSPKLQANLSNLISEGIQKLLEAQNVDGGWSWWGRQAAVEVSSDPFISAYVLLGLEAASDAGLDIGTQAIDQAAAFVISRLPQPGEMDTVMKLDLLAFQVYALRNKDYASQAIIDELFARRSELSPWALGLHALTVHEKWGSNNQVVTMLSDLEARAVRSATGVHWESQRSTWLLPGTPIFNTAVGVLTLARLDPASTSLPLALRYLMIHRNINGLWGTTFESNWVLMAITQALQGTGDYLADYDFTASINEIMIAEGSAAGPLPHTSVNAAVSIDSLHPDAPNTLLISRSAGVGTLYYRAGLLTYQPAETAEPISRGIRLQREYFLDGEGCPGGDGCTPIQSLVVDPQDPTQVITVALTVIVSHEMANLMIEDYIPAGTEVLNRRLLTSQTVATDYETLYDPRAPFRGGWGWWYFNEPQVYDTHVLWTADRVPPGIYTLTYELLPLQRGAFQVLPAHAWQYFFPEVKGTTAGDLFLIE